MRPKDGCCSICVVAPWGAGVRWIRNAAGRVIMDRRYNLTQLLNLYMGANALQDEDVDW